MLNKIILMGNLVDDITLRYAPNGVPIGMGVIANNNKYKNKRGERITETSYIDFVVFGKSAETLHQYITKGNKIILEGKIKQERWEDKQGIKRSKIILQVERFDIIDFKEQKPQTAETEPYPF